MSYDANAPVPRIISTLDEEQWFGMFVLRIHTLDASVFSALASIHAVNTDPREVMDGLLLYSPKKDRYVIDRRQIIDIIRQKLDPEKECFQERLNQLVEITSVGSVRSRMYYQASDRMHLWNFTEALADKDVPALAKERLGQSKSIRTLHREIATQRMRGFSSSSLACLQLDRHITMILSQEACFSSRGEDYILSLIQH